MSTAKISACIIAYNHEKFIEECLLGALSQKVNFDYEIIISEDCSTDNTRTIIKKYAKKYPDKIKLFLNEKNLGLIGNWTQALRLCQGKYIAICEGDDYWTDPNKLQKQFDFLEANPDFALTSHNAIIIDEKKQKIRDYCRPNHPSNINLEYLLAQGSGGPTCSLVIRNNTIQNLPNWFDKMHACDWTIQVMAARHGKMKYFNDIMSAYRKHGQGANFSSKQNAKKMGLSDFALPAKYTLEMIKNLNKYFNYKYDKLLRQQSTYWYYWYVREYLNINDYANAKKFANKILKELFPFNYWKNKWMNKKIFLKLLLLNLPSSLIKLLKT